MGKFQMSNNNDQNQRLYETRHKDEINLEQIFQFINRKKKVLGITILSFFLLATLYNMISKPIYESYVVAKKEEPSDSRDVDQLKQMFSMQTTDNLSTEIEIIKSGVVLKRVISELNLALIIQEIEWHNGDEEDFDFSLREYADYLNSGIENVSKLPRFEKINVDHDFPGGEILIQKSANGDFAIYNIQKSELMSSKTDSQYVHLKIPGLEISLSWPLSTAGDKLYLKINTVESIIANLNKTIRIARIGETNLAKLTVESESPQMAQILANIIIEKYRNVRLENKRQNVMSSFQFVNDQLEDVKQKLEIAEGELSAFKSENQIAIMDESSRDIIQFLSNLESEKIKVDLELGEYQNKKAQMTKELQNKGYFDQTNLTPQNSDGRGTPFSILLGQLSDLEINRLKLLQRRKENHPDIITINEQIDQVKSKLGEYNQNTITSYDILINTLKNKRADLNRLIGRYSKKIENLPEQNSELIQLTRNKNVYEKMFTLLLDKREEFRLAELSKMQDIIIIESAQISHKPVRPRKILNISIALILGIMVGFGIIFTKGFFEKRITTIEDFEKIAPYPLLTIIPKYNNKLLRDINQAHIYNNRLVTLMEDQSFFRESYRVLDVKLKNFVLSGYKSLIITSCEENTGKTSIAANFAISLAMKNKKVLLIDCDLRKASVATILSKSHSKPGLIQYLTEDISYSYVVSPLLIDKKADKYLDVITAGGTVEHSSDLLESQKMKELIEDMSSIYDQIIIDTPPLTRLVDTLVIGSFINHLILVIRPDHTYKDSVLMAIEELDHSDIEVLGYIMNAADIKNFSGKYKYGYGYGYGYPVQKMDKMIG
jgi:capsular exopolysaccharide synthesis family protein